MGGSIFHFLALLCPLAYPSVQALLGPGSLAGLGAHDFFGADLWKIILYAGGSLESTVIIESAFRVAERRDPCASIISTIGAPFLPSTPASTNLSKSLKNTAVEKQFHLEGSERPQKRGIDV